MTIKNGMRPVHPGELLREDYLRPLGLSAAALARALRVPPSRIASIVAERRAVTPDVALRLARYFGGETLDAIGWIQMQAAHDLKVALTSSWAAIELEVLPREACPPASVRPPS